MQSDSATNIQIPINFNVEFEVRKLTNSQMREVPESESDESNFESENTTESTESPSDSENEVFVVQLTTSELQQASAAEEDVELKILSNQPNIISTPLTDEVKDIYKALEESISRVTIKFKQYILADSRNLCLEFMDVFEFNHKKLKPTNILEFDIKTLEFHLHSLSNLNHCPINTRNLLKQS